MVAIKGCDNLKASYVKVHCSGKAAKAGKAIQVCYNLKNDR